MTGPGAGDRGDQRRVVRRFAALSGHFDPQEALDAVPDLDGGDTEAVVALAADLAATCDTQAGRRGTWLMRGPERRAELASLSGPGALRAQVDWRRRTGQVTRETRDLLDALLGANGFDVAGLRGLTSGAAPRDRIERAAVALDRAGGLAPAGEVLGTLRATLTRDDNRARGAGLLADGFVGRTAELDAIAAWLASPAPPGPVTALFVSGRPGIGKSTLLEQAVRQATDRPWIVVRLDFDQAGLDVRDWIGLTVELGRQIAAEIGEPANDLRETRLVASAATVAPSVKGESREQLPGALAGSLAEHLRLARRPLLLVLDTLEVLRGRGETHPQRLFGWLDAIVGAGLAPLKVLAAGRGDALDSAPGRVARRASLDEQTIAELPAAARDVVRRVRGERSSTGRPTRHADGADLDVATGEFEALVGRGDWTEGRLVYEQVFRDAVFDARSRTADVVRAFLWRSGDWREAKRLLDERDRHHPADDDLALLPPVLAAPRMEMRAELAARQLIRSIVTDPDLAALAAAASGQGLRSELSDGALGFVLERAGRSRPISTARGYDGVGAVLGIRGPEPVPDAGSRELGVAAGRLGRRVGEQLPTPDAGSAAGPLGARFLAVLMPYTDVAVTVSRVRGDPAIGRHAEAVDRRLTVLGGLPPHGVGPWTVLPAYGEAIDGLAAMGLFAEWAGAAAFVLRHPDLALIARSAERWRRTAAGCWWYGSVPATWPGWRRSLDVTVADRVDGLRRAADPVAQARRQLGLWSGADAPDGDPAGDPAALLAELRRRLPGSLERARAVPEDRPHGAAQVLLRHHVPSAFVPALAVLITRRQL